MYMKKSALHISNDGLSVNDQELLRKIRLGINAKLLELSTEYNRCNCNTCRITVLNRMEDIVNAELFYWNDTLVAPINSGHVVDMESLDNSIIHIIELQELIEKLNFLRKQLFNEE